MFFNQDILFGSGSCAQVWKAGNGEFRNMKGRRNKHFQRILRASIVKMCKDLRTLLPAMGTSNGPGLKTMGTLLKGVGIIYSLQLDAFARDVYQATLLYKRVANLGRENASIDVPVATEAGKTSAKATHTKEVDVLNTTAIGAAGFGELALDAEEEENFGQFDFDEGIFGTPRAFPSRFSRRESEDGIRNRATPPRSIDDVGEDQRPRSTRKRQFQNMGYENEESVFQDVMSRLQVQNERAHCLPEADDAGLLRPHSDTLQEEYDFGDLDFGNGNEMLFPGAGLPGEQEPLENVVANEEIENNDPTAGLPSHLDTDIQPGGMQTPPRASTLAENTREHRNNGHGRDLDQTVMSLDEVEPGSVRQRGRGVLRRRLALKVDAETKFTMRQLNEQMRTAKEKDKMELLHQKLDNNRALAKTQWKNHIENVDTFIRMSGRLRPNQSRLLMAMTEDILTAQSKRPHRRISDVSVEEERAEQTSNILNGASTYAARDGRTLMDLEPNDGLGDGLGVLPPEPSDVNPVYDRSSPPRVSEGEPEAEAPFDNGQRLDMEMPQQQNEPEPEAPPLPKKKSRTSARGDGTADHTSLASRLDGSNTFSELYPPEITSRKKAALAFLSLLKLQAAKTVLLHQDEPYGPIRIEKLKK